MTNVLSIPNYKQVNDTNQTESGVRTVVNNYYEHAEKYGIRFVDDPEDADLIAAHAGIGGAVCQVAHLHGMYFTGDFPTEYWQEVSNKYIVDAIRNAKTVTVPSKWVAEIFQRDMRFTPEILPHGVDWDGWQHEHQTGSYILGYAKNRAGQDVCDPSYLSGLARKFGNIEFKSTFHPDGAPDNVTVTGVLPYKEMKSITQQAAVFVQAIKETFGLHALEACAAGVPVAAYNHGGIPDFVQHGVNGYLAEPGNVDDLANGVGYCLKYRDRLGENGRELARLWTWEKVVEKLAGIYQNASDVQPASVAVVIPCYNKEATLERAVKSALDQYRMPERILIIDDGSTDESGKIGKRLDAEYDEVEYYHQNNAGVAEARNHGVRLCDTKYICCLDADDAIAPAFLDTCLHALENDSSLHIAYTALQWVKPDGSTGISEWPREWDFDAQLERKNQVPTCCVFRKETFDRLGGYRKRYAPTGCGSEDAALWTSFGLHGYKAARVSDDPLFIYSFMSGGTAQEGYSEVDWLQLYPAVYDGIHNLGSYAKPKNEIAHPVRMYDEPLISVIIPVGPGHTEKVLDALDSVEGQRSFRKWETIVVNDSGEQIPPHIIKAFPYVKWLETEGKRGPGHARNKGVDIARGSFIVFLDADDMLLPDFMYKTLQRWDEVKAPSIIYTNYLSSAIISEEEAQYQQEKGKLRKWGGVDGLSIMAHPTVEPRNDYDCEAAQSMPRIPTYHWCLVTCLIPKAWHYEIGGFDEQMESWEDVDYHWRMAWAGKCYAKVREELVAYRMYTGQRRYSASADTSEGRQIGRKLLRYMDEKKKGVEIMPCAGCNKNRATPVPPPQQRPQQQQATGLPRAQEPQDGNFVMVFFTAPHRGDRRVIGGSVHAQPVPGVKCIPAQGGGFRIDYGYHSSGEQVPMKVHVNDMNAQPGWFTRARLIKEAPPVEREQPKEPESVKVEDTNVDPLAKIATSAKPTEKPKELPTPPPMVNFDDDDFDPQTIPGVTARIADQLDAESIEDLKAMTKDDWMALKGVADVKADMIMHYLQNLDK